jgi:hypothetical protein
MKLKDAIITLDVNEVQTAIAIDLDGDAEKALEFVRHTVAKKIKKSLEST